MNMMWLIILIWIWCGW